MAENTELTTRETEILALIAEGKSNKEIAAELVISINTVKVHVSNIFQKIEVSSRTEATLYAIEQGIVQLDIATIQTTEETTPDISATPSGKHYNGPSNWLKKRWWIVLLGFVILFAIIQQNIPSLSFFTSAPSQNSFVDALNQNRLESVQPMPVSRVGFSSLINEGKIYTIGGKKGEDTLGFIESYLIDSDSWETLSEKPTPVSDIKAVFLRGAIYVPGGKLTDGSPTDILEVFIVNENKWENRASLPEKVSNYALATFEGQLFLFGGWNGSTETDKVFRYDPSLDEWFPCASMPTARKDASATVLGGEIFVIGGSNDEKEIASNESYHPSFAVDNGSEWEINDDLPFTCNFCSSNSLSDQMFVTGRDKIWQYSQGTQKWSEILLTEGQTLPSQVQSVISPDGYLFIFGGADAMNIPANVALKSRVVYTISIPNILN